MTRIMLTVTGAQAWPSVTGPLTSGMVGVPITIEYDEAWDGLTKNLVCRCSEWGSDSGEHRTILNVGETAVVAHEVMKSGMYLYLGIEGYSSDGMLVMPTTWASCGKIQPGANSGAELSADPTLPVWDQLQTEIAQLKRDALTQEQMAGIQSGIQAATQAAVVSAGRAESAATRAENAANASRNVNPVTKTEDMTQPVGRDSDGRLWTAPTAGNGGGEEDEAGDILLGTLPMTISESNCYLLSDTNATISTGEGAAQLLDLDVQEPYIGDTTHNGGAFEVIGKNTVKVFFENVEKNAAVYFPAPIEGGKTYTIVAKLVERSSDIANNKVPVVRISSGADIPVQATTSADGSFSFKTYVARDGDKAYISLAKVDGYVAGETYATVAVYFYEGEHTEIPAGTTFDILAGEKYNTDGYMGATLSAVAGGPVQVYKVNTAGAEAETDNGGVIFFGDSILHYSDVVSRYAAKTGKPIVNCAVGGTRMSASRDSSNAYYPLDMANIADAIASGNFSAQLGSGVATAGFTTLASANIANYKAIVLEFGTNDFSAKVPFDGTDAASIKGAVKHILRTILTKYPNMRIVVLSTLQYVTLGTGTESGIPTHDDGDVWQMNEVIREVCESDEFCVPWVDMYHAFGQNGITRNTLNSDGVHLTSPNGAKRYADILTGKLNGLGI